MKIEQQNLAERFKITEIPVTNDKAIFRVTLNTLTAAKLLIKESTTKFKNFAML